MSPRPHGMRAHYQAGCRCLPCKVANTTYERTYRQAQARQKPLLGAKMSPSVAQRLVRQLLIERFTKAELARRLGLKKPRLVLHPDAITVRKHLKIRRLYRQVMLCEAPLNPDPESNATRR